jgi:hypothetical protein
LCQGADDVIGFHAIDPQQRQAHRSNAVEQRLQLRAQIVGHGRARRFISFEQRVPECFARRVEHHRDQLRRFFLAQFLQHVEHAEHRAGRLATGVRQRRQRVKRAIQITGAVHQDELALCSHYLPGGGGVVAGRSGSGGDTGGGCDWDGAVGSPARSRSFFCA